MDDFFTFLENRLQEKLPGRKAQLKMAPEPMSGGKPRRMEPPESAGQSSVLALIFPNEKKDLELVLTLRTNDINHGGQISFPGGRAEEGESVSETALREAQ
ncbi:MAG TPA: NUDIX domain-containing protein [Balneolaceae bacterium]|nr:NUDIX domain-containing protein [Balneolaceae bacterium]